MNVEVDDYREFLERKYFVEFDEGNRSVWDAEKCLAKICCEEEDDEFEYEEILTHAEANELGKSVKVWNGHAITSVSLFNSIHFDGNFVGD